MDADRGKLPAGEEAGSIIVSGSDLGAETGPHIKVCGVVAVVVPLGYGHNGKCYRIIRIAFPVAGGISWLDSHFVHAEAGIAAHGESVGKSIGIPEDEASCGAIVFGVFVKAVEVIARAVNLF